MCQLSTDQQVLSAAHSADQGIEIGIQMIPHIWNVDESGVGDVPNEQQVIGITGVPASQTVAGEKPKIPQLLPLLLLVVCVCPQW